MLSWLLNKVSVFNSFSPALKEKKSESLQVHHIPSSWASSAGGMERAVVERQEIERKKNIFKVLGSLRRDQGMHEGGGNKGISELRQGEKVSGEAVRS